MSRSPRARPVVLCVAVHPASVAATRLRVMQYGPALDERGLDLRLWSFLAEADLPGWYRGGLARVMSLARALARLPSLRGALRGAGVVVVQREAFPFGPLLVERLCARGRRLVWDVDDAVWVAHPTATGRRVPQWLRATAGKYERLCALADEVWAGSEVLAAWCRRYRPDVAVVPTVVDVPDVLPAPASGSDRVAGWIGSPTASAFIDAVLPDVLAAGPPLEVLVVGALAVRSDLRASDGVRVVRHDWTQEAEASCLARMRVGLYPVDPGHPLAEGKCGLKAILYMAHGVVPVVTPTTTNAAIVRDGVDGLHARTTGDWTTAVRRLLDDDELYESCRRAGHARVLAHYSLASWAPVVAERLAVLAA